MTLLLSVAALLPRLLLGFCIVHFLWSAVDGKSFLVKIFLSAGIGFGLSSLFSFLWIWAGLPLSIYAILESLIAIVLAVIVFFYNRPLFTFKHTSDKTNTIWALLLAFGFFLFVVNFLLLARQHPHGLSDAWINWNVVARFISLGGADWQNTFRRQLDHPDYPLYLAMTNAVTWSLIREPSTWGPVAFHFVNTFFTAGLLFSLVNRFRDFKQAALATLIFISLPFTIGQGIRQYADMLLAQLILAAGGLMLLYLQTKETRFALLAGLFIGLAGWAKNEGIVTSIGFTALWTLIATKADRQSLKNYLIGLAFPFVVVILYKLFLAPSNDLLSAQGNLSEKILDAKRYEVIVKQALVTSWNLGGAPLSLFGIIILTTLVLGRSLHRIPGLWMLPAVIGIQLAAYFGTYLITPQDLPWHLSTSLDRLYLHVFPLALCWFFLWLRSPEELSSKES